MPEKVNDFGKKQTLIEYIVLQCTHEFSMKWIQYRIVSNLRYLTFLHDTYISNWNEATFMNIVQQWELSCGKREKIFRWPSKNRNLVQGSLCKNNLKVFKFKGSMFKKISDRSIFDIKNKNILFVKICRQMIKGQCWPSHQNSF